MDDVHNDKLLAARIAEGDESAFTELFYNYLPLIRSIVLKLTNDHQAVDDLVQEIFLKIWLTREQLPEIEKLKNWILHLAYNKTFNWLRQKKVRSITVTGISGDNDRAAESPTDPASLEETRRLIANAIDQLPEQAHKVYQLNRQYGYSIAEISSKMNLAPQSVKNTLSRAIKSIREHLKAQGIDLPMVLLMLILNFSDLSPAGGIARAHCLLNRKQDLREAEGGLGKLAQSTLPPRCARSTPASGR